MNSIKYYLHNPKRVLISALNHFGGWISDEMYLKLLFRLYMGYDLNLKKPRSFAEKLQWLKLHDRKPIYHQMVDKVDSKSFIDRIIGKGKTVPTLGVYDTFESIDWKALPKRFILKATHDSGSYYIVNDKNKVNKEECKRQLYVHWKNGFYLFNREWQYKGLRKRIIAEPLLAEPQELREFKFFCFNGEPKFYQICLDRDRSVGGSIVQCVDIEGNLLDMKESSYNGRTTSNTSFNPRNKDQMISIAKQLSNGLCFLRVDFFETEDSFYVGELTFHESAGFCSFSPDYWNIELGDWIDLSIIQ